jgi:hypothetical protein
MNDRLVLWKNKSFDMKLSSGIISKVVFLRCEACRADHFGLDYLKALVDTKIDR